jgi:aminoglycoside phosphotransferase (APT) family kinase protein
MEKADITPALVFRLVAAQFPQWAELPVTRIETDGNDNTTFRLGDEMSVRLPSAEPYVAQVDKEQRWLPILADQLPVPIPHPLARGIPGFGYPWQWSVYRWLKGSPATIEPISNQSEFATALADFLAAMYRIDPTGGPPPGLHNFFRGGPLTVYDAEARNAIATLGSEINTHDVTELWEAAIGATWHGSPVWIHGDVSAENLLVDRGRLNAVIDFGCSAVGDPACDLTIAWTFFSGSARETFQAHVPVDAATWTRSRGWAVWKALITLVRTLKSNPERAARCRRVIEEVIAEHKHAEWRGGRVT